MLSKEEIIKKYKKQYKPVFLLAWSKFLTYDELVKTDNTEVLEKAGMLESAKEWDKNVIKYTDENVLNALCVALDIAIKDITISNDICKYVYLDDIYTWLRILENKEIQVPKKLNKNSILQFYYNISDYYQLKLK